MQVALGHSVRQLRRALIEKARQVAGRRRERLRLRPATRRRLRRQRVVHRLLRMNHALVDLAHSVADAPPASASNGSRRERRRRGLSGGILRASRSSSLRIGGQRVGLAVLFHLQPVLQVPQELVSRRQPRVFAVGEQVPCRAGGTARAWCRRGEPTARGRRAGAAGTAPGTRYRECRRGASLTSRPLRGAALAPPAFR